MAPEDNKGERRGYYANFTIKPWDISLERLGAFFDEKRHRGK